MSDSCVAVVAEKPSHLSGVVAVVDGELFFPVSGRVSGFCALSTDRTTPALLGVHGVVVRCGDAIAVLEPCVPARVVVVGRLAVPVSPLLFVVVIGAKSSTLGRLVTPLGSARNPSPFAPLPFTATILRAVVKFLSRVHESSPDGATVRNGCL